MSTTKSAHRTPARAASLAGLFALTLLAGDARAYVVRETVSGLPVHWTSSDVAVEIDPSLVEAVPEAANAAIAAALAWGREASAPHLQVTLAETRSSPAVDGRNVIYFAPDGFAGGALAITLVSYDDTTGDIVDADIVINGTYPFAVLPATARAPAGVIPVANEPGPGGASTVSGWPLSAAGSGGGGVTASSLDFDLSHVLVHETGHVLGLRDAPEESSDVMFLYTSAGDASRRTPTDDDLAGVAFLYAGSSSSQGCSASPTPARTPHGLLEGLVVCAYVLTRRRRAGLDRGSSAE